MNDAKISRELEKRRETKPSPGTIYPALKELKNKGLIDVAEKKIYPLTPLCKKELKSSCKFVCNIFYDMKEMQDFCE